MQLQLMCLRKIVSLHVLLEVAGQLQLLQFAWLQQLQIVDVAGPEVQQLLELPPAHDLPLSVVLKSTYKKFGNQSHVERTYFNFINNSL